ncbi:variable large family protein (plasmid) [Borrelia coriaceae]|uniref:Variable large protein n=1 Tax=Borrelia coriaceae ATCC 43381 TaxID=1408429 RepID=W5SX65_9SPIR|nr:variable large family protein [Borrelia coriaceae]AHH11457.1 Variable major outer membrane lipoprotein [Borrelia coriaceae ATCC 43381]UPA17287.1 variable large family protein [Borrelia coriaceae]
MKINIKNRIKSICATLFISLFLSCNNGIEELQKQRDSILSISNLRQNFLDIFTSFSDMFTDAFGITTETTKKQVGEHLGKVGDAVQAVKGKLENIKADENFDLIKDKAESIIIKAIETLGKIVEGTNKIKVATKDANGPIGGHTTDNQSAVQAIKASVEGLVEGISMIYRTAKEANIDSKGEAKKTITNVQAVGKLFGTNSEVNGGNGSELKAAHIALTAVSGADILAAIDAVKDQSGVPGNIDAATNAFEMAIANASGANNITGDVNTNASAIAAGIALKAMAQNGKLATVATHAPGKEVNALLIETVTKTLNELLSTIRRTVDKCLKDVSDLIK